MNGMIAALLAQDALTSGAIYALLAISLVMVFSTTRILLIPQGEIVSLSALTLASLEAGHVPGTLWLLGLGGLIVTGLQALSGRIRGALLWLAIPGAIIAATRLLAAHDLGAAGRMALTLAICAPLSVIMYQLAFRPLARAPTLVLLIVAMAVHVLLTGFSLMVFGPEGFRTRPLLPGTITVVGMPLRLQALVIIGTAAVLLIAMALYFGRTLGGKALRATASNATGARLVGIRPEAAGEVAFLLAGLIGCISGMLISSMTTIYFDTGFMIGLKGFMAAIMAGLGSYPLAAAGAVLIGGIESYASFYASAFKDVIVFALIIPVLIWRNMIDSRNRDEEEE